MTPPRMHIPGARRVAGVAYSSARRGARVAGRIANRTLARVLDVAESIGLDVRPPVHPQLPAAVEEGADAQSVPATMETLLRRSLRQTPVEGRKTFHLSLLRELAPDEARILARLAGGSRHVVVDVAEPGRDGRMVLENASSIGREAAVTVPDLTPAYVRHLLALGLAEIRPEDHSLREQYEILLEESPIRAAIDSAGGRGLRGARVTRRTLAISPIGRELWESVGNAQTPDG